MKMREFPDGTLFLQAGQGEEVLSAITGILEKQGIFTGFLSAIGACGEAEVAFWDPILRQYLKRTLPGPLEILALTGNVARLEDGKPFIHAHAVLGDREMNCRGGHLFRAVAEPTCEIVLRPVTGVVERRLDEACGLRLWSL